jgi:hypothetical protein
VAPASEGVSNCGQLCQEIVTIKTNQLPCVLLCILQAVQSRLDALENDNADDAPDPFGLAEGDDDEFVMGDSEDDGEPIGCAALRTRQQLPYCCLWLLASSQKPPALTTSSSTV